MKPYSSRIFQCIILVVITSAGFLTGIASAADRVALIIGNSRYENASSLDNPTNDADGMAKTLTRLGFKVSKIKDVTYNKMRLALRTFSADAAGSDIALIFYAGHGMEVDKHNYLIPIDAKLATDRDIDFEAIPLDHMTQAASGAKQLSLVLLDACRNNPFAASMKRTLATRSIGRGLAQVEPTAGTLVSFAAKEGTVAADGKGRNSPYTRALMKHLQEPGLEINFLFRKVRDAVLKETNGDQEPFYYGSLPGRQIYLTSRQIEVETETVVDVREKSSSANDNQARSVYNDIKNSRDITILEIFAKQFPNSIYAKFARSKIETLKQSSEAKVKVASLDTSNPSFRLSDDALNACDRIAAHGMDPKNKTGYAISSADIIANADKAVRLCRIATNKYPNDRQSIYHLGRSLYAAKMYDQADKQFRKAAALGDVHSIFTMGYREELGEGKIRDYKEAARLYQLAAESDDVAAVIRLAGLVKNGHGVNKDIQKAIKLYKKASGFGNLYAARELGFLYLSGKGTIRNYSEAARYFKIAAEKGDGYSLGQLGYMHKYGFGLKKSDFDAVRYYKLAVEKNYLPAFNNLGNAYKTGEGVTKDYGEAIRLYNKAQARGNAFAAANLGYMYESGLGIKQDYTQAAKYYKLAVEKNVVVAEFNLANLYFSGRGISKDINEAMRLYRKASEKNQPSSLYRLAYIYNFGKGATADPPKAAKYMFRALKYKNNLAFTEMTNNPKSWSKTFRRELQREMKQNGFYSGAIDGSFGSATKAAISKVAGK